MANWSLTPPWHFPRLDHQSYAPEIWVGLLITSLYLIRVPPRTVVLPIWVEFFLISLMLVGSAVCTLGALIGTRHFFPRVNKRTAYVIELVGLPMIAASLAGFTYAAAASPSLLLVAIGGGLGLTIEVGSIRMMIDLAHHLKNEKPDCPPGMVKT